MSKRSPGLPQRPRGFWQTPRAAVVPLVPFLPVTACYGEPCAGANALIDGLAQLWPSGHALCACSETEFSLWRQRMRGALSQLPTASGPWIWQEPDAEPTEAQLSLFGAV